MLSIENAIFTWISWASSVLGLERALKCCASASLAALWPPDTPRIRHEHIVLAYRPPGIRPHDLEQDHQRFQESKNDNNDHANNISQ